VSGKQAITSAPLHWLQASVHE